MRLKKKVSILAAIVLLTTACIELRVDTNPNPALLDYHTVETDIEGVKGFGINGVIYAENTLTANRYLDIYSVIEGDVHISGCGVDWAQHYKNSETIRIYLGEIFGESFDRSETCTLDIMVAPVFERQWNQAMVVHPLIGKVDFYIVDQDSAFLLVDGQAGYSSRQVREGHEVEFAFTAPEAGEYLLACPDQPNVTDSVTSAQSVKVKFDALDFHNTGSCRIAFKATNGKIYEGAMYLQVFDKSMVQLPFPDLRVEPKESGWKISTTSSNTVTYVRIDTKFSNKLRNSVNQESNVVWIRQYTVAGRSNIVGIHKGEVIYKK